MSSRILVIEDQDDFRATVTAMLESAGHVVESTGDGRKGMELIASGGFDLLVTDILMPEVDGIELLTAARNLPTRLPVVAISGGGAIPASLALSLSTSLGASAVLYKPFLTEELLDAVTHALAPRNGSAPDRGTARDKRASAA